MPIILHGGDDGELNHHFKSLKETIYIFDLTLDEIMTFDFGEGERVPILEHLIQLAGKKMYINFEVKVPQDPHQRERYNYQESINLVHELVVKYEI